MKVHPVLRVTLTTASALAIAVPSAPAVDFGKANPLKWFKGKEETVPSASEKNSQEAAAAEMLRDAKTAASTGNSGRAQSLYKDIVARYRFTDAASVAQFEHSALLRSSGKLQDAYDGYQKFINNYRQSPRFNDALQQQFEIAEEAKAGKKQPSLLLIPMKLDKSELVKMYEGVIKNSPYGKYSPYAQFAIGEVYQDDGDKAMANASYQAVVENYPNTKLASEAQFRIGAISSAAARKTQDAQNLNATRDALESYKLTNPTGERTGEAESLIQEVNTSQSFRSLEIGKFYEKSGKAKAAAIYYNEAIKFGAPEAALDARNRLAGLAAAFPDEMKEQAATGGVADYTVPAAVNLKNRDEYSGPPAPLIAKVNRKPEMRVEPDSFQPVPLKEPELPTRPGTEAPNPGMILPPADGKPAPGAPLPVPPVPAGALEAPSLAPLPVPAPPAPAPAPAPEAAAPAPAPVPEAPAPAPEPAPKAN